MQVATPTRYIVRRYHGMYEVVQAEGPWVGKVYCKRPVESDARKLCEELNKQYQRRKVA